MHHNYRVDLYSAQLELQYFYYPHTLTNPFLYETVLVLVLVFTNCFAIAICTKCRCTFSCKANDLTLLDPERATDPTLLSQIASSEAELEAFTQQFANDASRGGGNYTIPVVFHIIHENGVENIADEQVFDAMRILNDDFNKLNSDWQNVRPEFVGIVSDVGVNFELAKKDPQEIAQKALPTVSALPCRGPGH